MKSTETRSGTAAVPGAWAPVLFLRVAALGAELAVQLAQVQSLVQLAVPHAVLRHASGLAMVHEGDVIPLVDYRCPESNGGPWTGEPALLATVLGRRFAIAVDRVGGSFTVESDEICAPDPALVAQCPYLTGCVLRGGREIYLIDIEVLLGPAVRGHLLKA